MALARLLILLLTAGCTSPGLRHEPWPPTPVSPVADQNGWQFLPVPIPGDPQRSETQDIE